MEYTLPTILPLDNVFRDSTNTIFINDFLSVKSVDELIETLCDATAVSDICSCSCGNLKGEYYEGALCSKCNTTAISTEIREVSNDTWLDVPDQIGPVLHPVMYQVLNNWLRNDSNKNGILATLMNIDLPIAPEFEQVFQGQGFDYFRDNFAYIIDYFTNTFVRTKTKKVAKYMVLFLEQYADRIWCTKLPILAKELQTVTNDNGTKLVDKSIDKLLSAMLNLSDALLMEKVLTKKRKFVQRKFFGVYEQYCQYHYVDIIKNNLNPKRGHLRKHLFGSRFHLSFRGVIVPICEPHNGDEIHLPWKIGLSVFTYHLIGILINRYNYAVSDAYSLIQDSYVKYNYLLDQLMQEIVKGCPYRGFPHLFDRNPSLKLEAAQLLFITRVKPALTSDPYKTGMVTDRLIVNSDVFDDTTIVDDENFSVRHDESNNEVVVDVKRVSDEVRDKLTFLISDNTIAISPLIISGPNADFDGDEMNGVPIVEMGEVPKYMNFHPTEQVLSSDKLAMGNTLKLSNQLCVLLTNWMNDM